MKKTLFIALILSIYTILPQSIIGFPKAVFAEGTQNQILKISPFIFSVQLSPNKTYEFDMKIENLQNMALPIRVSTEDFLIQDEEGSYQFGENTENSLTSWITIENPNQILDPLEKGSLRFTVQTPEKIAFGGYHGMIFIEPLLPSTQQYSSLLSTKIGAPVLASIGSSRGQVNSLQIVDANWPTFLTSTDSVPLNLRIKNNSMFHVSVKPLLTLDPFWGTSQKITLDEKLIFPGRIRGWSNDIKNTDILEVNVYRSTLVIPLGNGTSISKSHLLIYIPIRILIVFIVGVIGLVILILQLTGRIQVKRFVEVLMKGK